MPIPSFLTNPDLSHKINLLNTKHNPYLATLKTPKSDRILPIRYGHELLEYKGSWLKMLSQRAGRPLKQLVVDIGCHKGLSLIHFAETYPNIGFIGVDITFKRNIITSRKIFEKNLKNAFSALIDARHLRKIFNNGEVNDFLIFFPDPWLKKSQTKHRLFTSTFLFTLKPLLRTYGHIWIKTDQKELGNNFRDTAIKEGLQEISISERKSFFNTNSIFQQKFSQKNLPIFLYVLKKSKTSTNNNYDLLHG